MVSRRGTHPIESAFSLCHRVGRPLKTPPFSVDRLDSRADGSPSPSPHPPVLPPPALAYCNSIPAPLHKRRHRRSPADHLRELPAVFDLAQKSHPSRRLAQPHP